MILAHLGLVCSQYQATINNERISSHLNGPILTRENAVDCHFQGSHIIVSKGNDLMDQHDGKRLQVVSVRLRYNDNRRGC